MCSLTILCVLGSGSRAHAGINAWTSNGLDGQRVVDLAVDSTNPATVYAVADTVFKSMNRGATWSAMDVLPRTTYALAIDPVTTTTLYAAGSFGVFKSKDGGSTWRRASSGLPYTRALVSILAIDPTAPNTLYAGTTGAGIFTSRDAGGSWTDVTAGFPPATPGTNPVPIPWINALAMDPSAHATVYAGTTFDGVFKSTDRGRSWTVMNAGFHPDPIVYALVIDPRAPATVYAGTDFGVYKSSDGGLTWLITELSYSFPVHAVVIERRNLYAASDGVYKSTNSGMGWQRLEPGLPPGEINTLAIAHTLPPTLYAGTFSHGVFSIQEPPPPCVGDCNGDGRLTVDELLSMVNIALGNASVAVACLAGDPNMNGQIDVAEIIAAVNNALNGCAVHPTPTPTPTAPLIGVCGAPITDVPVLCNLRLEPISLGATFSAPVVDLVTLHDDITQICLTVTPSGRPTPIRPSPCQMVTGQSPDPHNGPLVIGVGGGYPRGFVGTFSVYLVDLQGHASNTLTKTLGVPFP